MASDFFVYLVGKHESGSVEKCKFCLCRVLVVKPDMHRLHSGAKSRE